MPKNSSISWSPYISCLHVDLMIRTHECSLPQWCALAKVSLPVLDSAMTVVTGDTRCGSLLYNKLCGSTEHLIEVLMCVAIVQFHDLLRGYPLSADCTVLHHVLGKCWMVNEVIDALLHHLLNTCLLNKRCVCATCMTDIIKLSDL